MPLPRTAAIPILVTLEKPEHMSIDDLVDDVCASLEMELQTQGHNRVNVVARTPWEAVLPKHFIREVTAVELFAAIKEQISPTQEPELDWQSFSEQEMDVIHKLFGVLGDQVDAQRTHTKVS